MLTGFLSFDGDKLPVLSFIFASPDVLKQIRCILILDLISNNGETQVAGYSNIALKEAVEFIQSNYHIDEQVSFSTNRSILIQKDLELNSKRVGHIKGFWTFNICSRSDIYRF
jgi:hypothetical protein